MIKKIFVLTLCIFAFMSLTSYGAQVLKFKKVQCMDNQGIGGEAFSLLIPSGWGFESAIKWRLDNPATPAVSYFYTWNPKGKESVAMYPKQTFFWTNNPTISSMYPAGSKYFGDEVCYPMKANEALKEIVIPRFKDNIGNMKVVSEEDLPELAKAFASIAEPGTPVTADAAKMKIQYMQNGVAMEEEILCIVHYLTFQTQSMSGTNMVVNWTVDCIFSCKSEKGKFDKNNMIFQTIGASMKINPEWFGKYNHVVYYLIQNQIKQIKAIGEISRIISKTYNEMSEQSMASYERYEQMSDKLSDNFSQYIREVDEYYNPIEQKTVELPSGYNNVWTNSLGEYVLTDNPNYNPNVNSNLNWQQIQKK